MKIIITFLLNIISVAYLFSQETRLADVKLRPESPLTAQFLRYDQMPVSEYTGIPDISIPIFEIEEDGVVIPLKLSYHAGGIQVNQEASWVGLGWDLKLGSVIQMINDEDDLSTDERMVKKLPDYAGNSFPCPVEFPKRYNYPFMMPGPGWDPVVNIYPPVLGHSYRIATDQYIPINGDFTEKHSDLFDAFGLADSEPDIFKANFLGHSINFILDFKTNKYVVLNKKGYEIEFEDHFVGSDTWIITTPAGDKFYFAAQTYTITSAFTNYGGSGVSKYSTTMNIWLLTEIETKTGKIISIEYSNYGNSMKYPVVSHRYMKLLSNKMEVDHNFQSGGFKGYLENSMPATTNGGIITTTSTSQEEYYCISKITFGKGTILFHHSDRDDLFENAGAKLDKIEIFNYKNERVRLIDFSYDYFSEFVASGEKLMYYDSLKRLKLLSMCINNTGVYEFQYNDLDLPKRDSFAQDYWGYYNGCLSNKSLSPNPTRFKKQEGGDNGNNKSANLTYTKAGILEEIVYPTKGKVCFDYELNEFDNYWVPDYATSDNTKSHGNGLRIKNIKYYDNDNKKLKETKYEYQGGKASLIKDFLKYTKYDIFVNSEVSYANYRSCKFMEASTDFSSPNLLATFNGVGYDVVTKFEIDNESNGTGKIVTRFHNNPDIVSDSPDMDCSNGLIESLPAFKSYIGHTNGYIKDVSFYDESSNIIKREEYEYARIESDIFHGARIYSYDELIYKGYLPDEINLLSRNLIGFYPIYDFESLLKKKTTTEYFSNGTMVTTDKYNYNDNNQIMSYIHNVSNSNEEITYTYDYPSENDPRKIVRDMYFKNWLSEIISLSKNISGKGNVFSQNKEYTQIRNNSFFIKKLITRPQGTNSVSPISVDYIYDQVYGILLQKKKTDGEVVSYLWNENKQYIVAEVINCEYNDLIDLCNRLNLKSWDIEDLKKLRLHLDKGMMTIFKHKYLVGVIEVNSPSDITTYYEYDNSGRLIKIKDHNEKVIEQYDYHYKP